MIVRGIVRLCVSAGTLFPLHLLLLKPTLKTKTCTIGAAQQTCAVGTAQRIFSHTPQRAYWHASQRILPHVHDTDADLPPCTALASRRRAPPPALGPHPTTRPFTPTAHPSTTRDAPFHISATQMPTLIPVPPLPAHLRLRQREVLIPQLHGQPARGLAHSGAAFLLAIPLAVRRCCRRPCPRCWPALQRREVVMRGRVQLRQWVSLLGGGCVQKERCEHNVAV